MRKKSINSFKNFLSKEPFPHFLHPMLCHRITQPFDSSEWITEIKFDGYRAIAEIEKGNSKIYSRKRIIFNQFPELETSLKLIKDEVILDGEIIVQDENENHDFYMLRDYGYRHQGFLSYQVFDILYINGYNLTSLPLLQRKEILKEIVPNDPHIRYVQHIAGNAIDVFEGIKSSSLEGIIQKKADSTYHLGERSKDWLKLPKENLVDAVVIGYTIPNRTRLFGALVLGAYEGNELKYYGHAINVPENKEKEEIYHKLKPLEIDQAPLKDIPKSVIDRGVKWLEPVLVCEVNYGQIMRSGKLRRAYYRRLRDDVDPKEIERVKIV